MSNNLEARRFVLEGLCPKCYYLTLSEDRERLCCDKYKITPKGIVEKCWGYMTVSEGYDELISRMKANGELSEWI